MGEIPLPVLAGRAELIVHGVVTAVTTQPAAPVASPEFEESPARTAAVTLSVRQWIKGGGEAAGFLTVVDDANWPQFSVGDECIVLLEFDHSLRHYVPAGLAQGAYRVDGGRVAPGGRPLGDFLQAIRELALAGE